MAFPWVETSTGPEGFMISVCLLYDGTSRMLNRKWFCGEAGNGTCDPGLQGIASLLIQTYIQKGLSPSGGFSRETQN